MNKKDTSTQTNFLSDGATLFFGKMSASTTHEIKNSLAIINENAGLLSDLAQLTKNGHSLSPEKVDNISEKIQKQVQRTDLILKKLNRFSHSVDGFSVDCLKTDSLNSNRLNTEGHRTENSEELINLPEALNFIIDLSSRLIQRSECIIKVKTATVPVIISSQLFYVQYLIWRVIESMCYYGGKKDQISISFDTSEESSSIWFESNLTEESVFKEILETHQDKALIDHLKVLVKKNNSVLGLIWPKTI